MRIGSYGHATRARWLLAAACLAAFGCNDDGMGPGDGDGKPRSASEGAGRDPMQLGQSTLPSAERSVELAGLDGAEFPKPGDREFESAIALEDSANHDYAGGGAVGRPGLTPGLANSPIPAASAAPAAGAAESAPAASPAPQAAPPGNPQGSADRAASEPGRAGVSGDADGVREIVEADIVQAHGDILYVLNRYRGLVLIDMSVPDSPYVRGRVPFQAQPVDMYVRDGKAFVVMSDYFSYWQFDSEADPLGFHGSQVLVVDVQDPSRPEVSGSFNVDGEVTDTRIVGDVLYAVSKRSPEYWRYDTQDWQDTSWVLSIDLSDPAQIHEVAKRDFPGAANLIQVYEKALSVAAIDPNYYLVDSDNARQTKITYVDISDPAGSIRVGGSAYVTGAVQDKFKMDLSGGQLRVVSQDWFWDPAQAATLTVFDVSDPAQVLERARIPLATDVPGANGGYVQTGATRFAGDDLYLNLCWWTNNGQNCRVDFYDLSDPSAPARASMVAVDGPITHFEAHGDRLLALGQRYDWNSGMPPRVQIALFNVGELENSQRISAVELGDDYSSSQALQDYKAFKVLSDMNLILLPLDWLEGANTPAAEWRQGAQLVDWQNDQLVVRGRIAQRGYVERTIAFKERVLSISTQQIQVIDAADRDRPVETARLFLVRDVLDVFNIGGREVQLATSEDDGGYRFYVLPFGEDDMAESVAELAIDLGVMYQIRNGDLIYVFGYEPQTGTQLIRAADFSDPEQPRWRGEYRFADDISHIYSGGYRGYWSFYDYYWNPQAGQPVDNQLLPVTTRVVKAGADGRRYYQNALQLIDLRDPDNLHLASGSVDMPDFPFVNKASHGKILFSTHTEPALDKNGNPKKYHERYFVDRVDASDSNDLKLLPKLNVPGRVVDIDASGTLVYTVDYQWDEHGRRRNSFNVVKLENDTATLVTVLPVGDEIARARYLDREVWLSTHSYPWFGRSDDSVDSRQPYTRLTRLRIDEQGMLEEQANHDVQGYHFDLLDIEGTRVYLASNYPTGLLVLDTTDFASPGILGASRTIGYVSKLVREGDYLYLPMGSYGVRRVLAP